MKQKSSAPHRLHWSFIAFFALYITLPSHFAIGISDSLPLITASRAVLLLACAVLVWTKRDMFRPANIRQGSLNLFLTQDKPLRICMVIYFVLLVLVNATFLFETSESVKQLFVIVAEEYLLVWMVTQILDSREKIITALKVLLIGCACSAVIAALSVIFHENLLNYLNISGRAVVRNAIRYGMLRPAAGFFHPVYFGAYCAVMLPIGMYLTEHTENRRQRKLFAFCTALAVVGLVIANSRGSQLAFVGVAGLYGLMRILRREFMKLLRTYLPILMVALLITAAVFALSPAGRYRVGQFWDSLGQSTYQPGTDSTGPVDATDPTEPEAPTEPDTPDLSFGENSDGVGSRLVQLTGITYTVERSPLFGLGPNAHARGLVGYMFVKGHWSYVKTVDVNVVAIVSQYGLIGLLGFLALYGGLGVSFLRKKFRKDPLMNYLFLAFTCYMLCLVSISFLDKWFWVFTGVLLSTINLLRKEA